jgi:glutamine amidotransferase-like uncharacterized protein
MLTGSIYAQDRKIRVAIYDDAGGNEAGPKNVELSLADSSMFVTQRVDAEKIRKGVLLEFDVVVQPGGSGSKQAKSLGDSGKQQIRDFVARGGGYIGICAGAYLATTEYEWSLHMLNAKVIDRAHWNRGMGDVVIKMTGEGRKFFGLEDDTVTIAYRQGPLLMPDTASGLDPYSTLAAFETEIAKNGAPTGVMVGTTAIATGRYQKGRVLCFSPHPERSERLRSWVVLAVRWAAGHVHD